MYLIIIVSIFNSNTNYLLSRVVRISGNSDSIELNLLIQREIILDLNIPSKKHKQIQNYIFPNTVA